MSAAEKLKTTYAEYLALETSSGVRHEFVDGTAYAMAGGEPEHARLALSVGAELRQLLRGGACRVFSSDLKVRVPASGNAYYADAAVVCGPLARDAVDPLAVLLPRPREPEHHASPRVGPRQDVDVRVGAVQPTREAGDHAHGDFPVAEHHRLEGAAVDHQRVEGLKRRRRRRARLVVEDRHLPEKLPRPDDGQGSLAGRKHLGDLHPAALDDEHIGAGVALPEEHLPRGEAPSEAGGEGF